MDLTSRARPPCRTDQGAQDIGPLAGIFTFISYLAVVVNMALLLWTSPTVRALV
jgi:hypothetical protein